MPNRTTGPEPATNTPTLKANFSWTFVGNSVYAGSQWLILVLVAKLGTAEMVGQWALAIAVSTPIFLFSNLQLRTIQATDARYTYAFPDFMVLRIASISLTVCTIVLVTRLAGFDGPTTGVILAYAFAKAFDWVADVYFGHLQREERMDLIAKAMMLNGSLSLAALSVVLWYSRNLAASTIGYVAVSAMVLVAFVMPAATRSTGTHFRFHGVRPQYVASLARLALPMGFVACLASLFSFVPQYLLEHFGSRAELGIFAALAYLAFVGQTVTGALSQAAAPRLARYFVSGDSRAFRRLLARLLMIAVTLGGSMLLMMLLFGEPIIGLLYASEYGQHTKALLLLTAATALLFCLSMLGTAVTAMRLFRIQLAIHIANVGVVSAIGVAIIPHLGIQGAAWTLLAGAIVLCVGYGWTTLRSLDQRFMCHETEPNPSFGQ